MFGRPSARCSTTALAGHPFLYLRRLIEVLLTGNFDSSLQLAQGDRGYEKRVVLCSADPSDCCASPTCSLPFHCCPAAGRLPSASHRLALLSWAAVLRPGVARLQEAARDPVRELTASRHCFGNLLTLGRVSVRMSSTLLALTNTPQPSHGRCRGHPGKMRGLSPAPPRAHAALPRSRKGISRPIWCSPARGTPMARAYRGTWSGSFAAISNAAFSPAVSRAFG